MTNPRNRSHPAAFTLMELVVVLAILAVVTSLAVRSVDRVEDQGRYEANLRIMQEIETAVLGSPDDRALDGTRVLSGFVADMGRLPRTVEETVHISGIEAEALTLRELWDWPPAGKKYDVRKASLTNLAVEDPVHVDEQVYVPGGWRGPYLRLPMEETALRD
ncbi:MAG TPA: prepilin-type N-terminal cleavage/methylation domain-containing protein, partial [Verrucomicrobium sp.]|nr:prepilin-type N-terminal cleavage/methylation domain-containing protein [Verrucomicrobium sp.]